MHTRPLLPLSLLAVLSPFALLVHYNVIFLPLSENVCSPQ